MQEQTASTSKEASSAYVNATRSVTQRKSAMEKIAGLLASSVCLFAVSSLISMIQKPDLSLAPNHLNPRVFPAPPSRFINAPQSTAWRLGLGAL